MLCKRSHDLLQRHRSCLGLWHALIEHGFHLLQRAPAPPLRHEGGFLHGYSRVDGSSIFGAVYATRLESWCLHIIWIFKMWKDGRSRVDPHQQRANDPTVKRTRSASTASRSAPLSAKTLRIAKR